jgi:hypothetical protein
VVWDIITSEWSFIIEWAHLYPRYLGLPSYLSHGYGHLLFRLLHPQNRETGQKLGIATGLMFTLPFLAFYISMSIFSNKQSPENWAGAVAIIVTNIIVGGYCYVAYIEDNDQNDESGPKKGSSKQRVD